MESSNIKGWEVAMNKEPTHEERKARKILRIREHKKIK